MMKLTEMVKFCFQKKIKQTQDRKKGKGKTLATLGGLLVDHDALCSGGRVRGQLTVLSGGSALIGSSYLFGTL